MSGYRSVCAPWRKRSGRGSKEKRVLLGFFLGVGGILLNNLLASNVSSNLIF